MIKGKCAIDFEFNWLWDVLGKNGKVTSNDIYIARSGIMDAIDKKEVEA